MASSVSNNGSPKTQEDTVDIYIFEALGDSKKQQEKAYAAAYAALNTPEARDYDSL